MIKSAFIRQCSEELYSPLQRTKYKGRSVEIIWLIWNGKGEMQISESL